jgi:exopolysaccharide/PEP-CTERM locus tyrosine autokinase
MSIIEQALKKLQVSGHEEVTPPRPVAALGSIREIPAHNELNGNRIASSAPRRVVHMDREALVDAGYLPAAEYQRRMADQFRHAKRPLLAAALGRGADRLVNGCRIMITSSVPNEGKTFVSFNLAVSISLERDVSVVLVDADVAKRHVSQLFGIDREPGLLDAVQDEYCDIDALVLPTSFPNLYVLPAGRPADTATELLGSHRMESVVAKLEVGFERKRVVIFDSPPLLLTSESRALARHIGQIVLVVKAGVTPRHLVEDAVNCIGRERHIRLLLNQSESPVEAGYYYHDSAYGQYARETDRASESKK